jgi:hypothetical protein
MTTFGSVVLYFDENRVLRVAMGLLLSVAAGALRASGHHLPMGRLTMRLCGVLGLICYRWDAGHIRKISFPCYPVRLSAELA